MSEMPIEGTVHAERLSSHNALGARGDPRGDATSARSQAAGDDVATTHHRTCVWDAEALDGLNALPHARTGTCRHRDELARPCLQPQATDQFAWHSEDDQSNEVTRRLTGGLTACRSRSRRSIIERETSLPSSTPATTAFPHSLGRTPTYDLDAINYPQRRQTARVA